MALGAITAKNLDPQGNATEPFATRFNGLLVTRNTVVGDSSYPTGGSTLTPAQLGLPNAVLYTVVTLQSDTGSNNASVEARYDEVAQKLQCFDMTNTNASYAANQSHTTVECANTTNLSGLTWNILAFGY